MQRLLLLACFWIVACGGGGSTPATGTIQSAPTWVPGKYWGYFGDFKGQYAATGSHTSIAWIWDWGNDDPTERIQEARAAGIQFIVVGFWEAFLPDAEPRMEAKLARWSSLGGRLCVTPVDEPSPAMLPALNAWFRAINNIRARHPELSVCTAIMYDHYNQPLIEQFDVIAWDDYHLGCDALKGELDDLKARTRPTQSILVVPGVVYGQDPTCFVHTIMSDPRVAGGLAFIYGNGWNASDPSQPGIEGMPVQRRQACEAGRYILTGSAAGCA